MIAFVLCLAALSLCIWLDDFCFRRWVIVIGDYVRASCGFTVHGAGVSVALWCSVFVYSVVIVLSLMFMLGYRYVVCRLL